MRELPIQERPVIHGRILRSPFEFASAPHMHRHASGTSLAILLIYSLFPRSRIASQNPRTALQGKTSPAISHIERRPALSRTLDIFDETDQCSSGIPHAKGSV